MGHASKLKAFTPNESNSPYHCSCFPPLSDLQVLEEIRLEREEELRVQEEDLAVQAAVVHFQRAEKRTRALETYGAILKLQGRLVEEMRAAGALGGPEVAQSIRSHRQVRGWRTPERTCKETFTSASLHMSLIQILKMCVCV